MNWAFRKPIPTLTWRLDDSGTNSASSVFGKWGRALLIVSYKYNANAMQTYCKV